MKQRAEHAAKVKLKKQRREEQEQNVAAKKGGAVRPTAVDDDDDGFDRLAGPRAPPPVEAALPSPIRTSSQPSMSIEQAAKPNFYITVGDPHKVGDLTSSHIVYSVRTKVCGDAYLEAEVAANH